MKLTKEKNERENTEYVLDVVDIYSKKQYQQEKIKTRTEIKKLKNTVKFTQNKRKINKMKYDKVWQMECKMPKQYKKAKDEMEEYKFYHH